MNSIEEFGPPKSGGRKRYEAPKARRCGASCRDCGLGHDAVRSSSSFRLHLSRNTVCLVNPVDQPSLVGRLCLGSSERQMVVGDWTNSRHLAPAELHGNVRGMLTKARASLESSFSAAELPTSPPPPSAAPAKAFAATSPPDSPHDKPPMQSPRRPASYPPAAHDHTCPCRNDA